MVTPKTWGGCVVWLLICDNCSPDRRRRQPDKSMTLFKMKTWNNLLYSRSGNIYPLASWVMVTLHDKWCHRWMRYAVTLTNAALMADTRSSSFNDFSFSACSPVVDHTRELESSLNYKWTQLISTSITTLRVKHTGNKAIGPVGRNRCQAVLFPSVAYQHWY